MKRGFVVNEAIYKQPLVLFLGAGASRPLGLKTTVEFWEWLKLSAPEFESMYSTLSAVERYIEPSKEVEKPDVEAVLDFLEDLVRAGKLFLKLGGDEALTRILTRGVVTDIIRVDEYEGICNQIKDRVISHYSEIEEEKAFELYRPLLEKAIHQPLPVFTTNYDLAIEKAYEFTTTPSYELGKAPFNLIDGFWRERVIIPEWSRSAYESYTPAGADIILFKLHGSVDWLRTPRGAIQRLEGRRRDPGELKTVIAYPSRLKREIHEEPFRTNYDYLIACLLHAKVCAVIGFSFRDQEVVEEFRQAMELNKDLQLAIFDPNVSSITQNLAKKVGFERVKLPSSKEFSPEASTAFADVIQVLLEGK